MYPSAIPFVLVHLACLGAIWTGVTWTGVAIALALYWLRIFAIGAGYHRYFSHRAYETSRAFQFVLAFLAQTTAQKSVLWWAAKHREHHLHSDTPEDVHSPRQRGFVYSHLGWIFDRRNDVTDLNKIEDFAKYPELRWLHRHEWVAGLALAILCFADRRLRGADRRLLLEHGRGLSRDLLHQFAGPCLGPPPLHYRRRFPQQLAAPIFTMGEGWHNNHHAFQSSVRQGFRWWEYDPTFYLLKLLSYSGLIWKLKSPPVEVVQNRHRLGSRVIRRAATQVAESFNAERIAAAAAAVLGTGRLAQFHAQLSRPRPARPTSCAT